MFERFINWFKKRFGVTTQKTASQQAQQTDIVAKYENIEYFNPTATAAKKLANITCSDSTIDVSGTMQEVVDEETGKSVTRITKNPRSDFLNDSLKNVINELLFITTRTLGIGGVVLKPYVLHNGQIQTDIIPQNLFYVFEHYGNFITKAGFVAETIKSEDGKTEYTRLEFHTLERDGTYIIQHGALKGDDEVPLTSVPKWADLEPVVVISNVKQMLFSFVKCPTDNRIGVEHFSGVPITYGQDEILQAIRDIMSEIPQEYKIKKTFVGISELLFDKDNKLPESGVFKKFKADSIDFFQIFSPDIRAASYFDGLNYYFGLLEKAIGVNKGILTDMDDVDATATAIRRSTADTFTTVNSVRKNVEMALKQLVYAFDVLTNVFELAPQGEYKVNFDWSYALLEDSKETFEQLTETVDRGGLGVEELTAYVKSITVEEAVKLVPPQVNNQPAIGE